MPSDDSQMNRRKILKTTGIALAGLTGVSSSVSANPGKSKGRGKDRAHGHGKGNGHDHGKKPDWAEKTRGPGRSGPPKGAPVPAHVEFKHSTLGHTNNGRVRKLGMNIQGADGITGLTEGSNEFLFLERQDGTTDILHPKSMELGQLPEGDS